jgi:glutaredoxin 3
MSKFKAYRERALERVLAGLNRADEIGGEVRDFIQDRVLDDERYVRLRKRIDGLRGKVYVSRAEAEEAEAERAAEAAAAAPPPAASVVVEAKGLGDPDLPAQIYGRSSCPWTGRAITLLEVLKADYDFIDLDDSDHAPLESALIPETNQNTVPYIYLRGQFVGGFNALSELHRAGQLEYLLMTPAEREAANPAMKNITVIPRPNSDETAPGEA